MRWTRSCAERAEPPSRGSRWPRCSPPLPLKAFLHQQDLQQPCYTACTVNPRELTISGIPGATAVEQVPIKGKLPPNAGPPFEAFAVEFTIGSDLFYGYVQGDPGDTPPARFEQGAALVYKYASQHEQ
jgi:hypothetical protein